MMEIANKKKLRRKRKDEGEKIVQEIIERIQRKKEERKNKIKETRYNNIYKKRNG